MLLVLRKLGTGESGIQRKKETNKPCADQPGQVAGHCMLLVPIQLRCEERSLILVLTKAAESIELSDHDVQEHKHGDMLAMSSPSDNGGFVVH